ncbi:MAG TPA: lysoplasmalogenase, partial [Cyclobacteriaceae bacterium]|nr:lysoplasmalogenase [Cyclobacteriaceae bacterium]
LVIVLYPHLDKLLWPVIIYATVIVWMTLNALFRYGRTNALSFWLVFFGALFFMLSDSMLAINKFMLPFDYAGFFVMFTYITAQYLIVEGLLQHRIDSK